MRQSHKLIKSAIETAIKVEGKGLEGAQIEALFAVSQIAAASGPKNLQRLVAEYRLALIAGRAHEEYAVTVKDANEYIAVPAYLVRAAASWLEGAEREEREIAAELRALIPPFRFGAQQ